MTQKRGTIDINSLIYYDSSYGLKEQSKRQPLHAEHIELLLMRRCDLNIFHRIHA